MQVLLENFQYITFPMVIMWVIGGVLIYLAIAKEMEPTLLLPMGFGAILVNLPVAVEGTGIQHVLETLFSIGIEGAELFPGLKGDGSLVKAGTRINWGGAVKRAATDLWDTEANSPDNAPSMWEDIAYREGIRIIPETITAGAAFALDECGWWDDTLYKSTIDGNVWTHVAYPQGWEVVE